MNNEWLTAEEIADRLRLKPDTIILWARLGRIPAHRLSRKVIRFCPLEVTAALLAAAPDPASHPAHGPEVVS